MKQNILKYGIVAGITVVGYFLLFYFYDKKTMLGQGVQLSSYLIYAFFMYLAARKVETESFKTVLRSAFIVFLITSLFYFDLDYILFNFVDKSLAVMQKEIMIDYFSAGAKTIEDANGMRESILNEDLHSFSSLIRTFAQRAIGGFILSVIITFLIKKNQR